MLIPNSEVEAELPSLHRLETLVDMWDDLDHRQEFEKAALVTDMLHWLAAQIGEAELRPARCPTPGTSSG